ncbi:DUF6520 family protein [Flavobacterium saccharophilum]|uniref:Uncharacterized protein n=1 Tax=Flavobacterium saccharophilum TaxID=29534 RepID=A0A1M7FLP9_9FLAO|nr:DUF6520 family protein [Flavobacterium saccharophilum]SHM04910.1 hypothetical protein SAMN05444366_2175 [Flavobacterium saccharophilum]
MKKSLKNILPITIIAFGISGAFISTAMEKGTAKITALPLIGYPVSPDGKCTDIAVNCNDLGTALCRVSGLSGPVAYQKDAQNNCLQPLYRP